MGFVYVCLFAIVLALVGSFIVIRIDRSEKNK